MSDKFFSWMKQIGEKFTDFDALQEGFVDIKFNVFYAVKNAFVRSAEERGVKGHAEAIFFTYRSAIRMYEEYRMACKRAYGGGNIASVEEAKVIFERSENLVKSIADDVEQKLIKEGFDLEDIKCKVEKIEKCINNMFYRYLQEGRGQKEQEFVDGCVNDNQIKKNSR